MDKPFEIRCVEWGDMSDYHWAWCSSLQVALDNLKKLNQVGSLYEHYYVFEHHEDGSKTIPEYDRKTYNPLDK